MNIEDVFSAFNLKPKEDFGIEIPLPPVKEKRGGMFTASSDEESYSGDFYETREEAVKLFPDEAGLDPGDTFFVGLAKHWKPKIDADSILERLGEDAGEAVGEAADHWLRDLTAQQINDLDESLNETFRRWAQRCKQEPTFFEVESVTTHTVPEPPNSFLQGFDRRTI